MSPKEIERKLNKGEGREAAETPEEAGRRAAQGAKEGKAAAALVEEENLLPMERVAKAGSEFKERMEEKAERAALDRRTEQLQKGLGWAATLEGLTRVVEEAYKQDKEGLAANAEQLLKRAEGFGFRTVRHDEVDVESLQVNIEMIMDQAKKELGKDTVRRLLEGKKTTKEK